MRRALAFVVPMLLAVLLAAGAPAQDSRQAFEVKPGQLTQTDVERMKAEQEAARARGPLTAAYRPARTQDQVREMVRSIANGYRSACCPQWKMMDRSCPCYGAQIGMLTFLVTMGFERVEIDQMMVNGGTGAKRPDGQSLDLSGEYRQWLESTWIPANPSAFTPTADRYMSLEFRVRGSKMTFGWNHGWSIIIHESPRDWLLYGMLGFAALLLVGTFFGGFVLLRRKPGGAVVAGPGGAVVVGGKTREQVEAEIRALGDGD